MTDKKKDTALILLSGGLDSAVSIVKSNCNVKAGLIFDYGQLSFKNEYKASKKFAELYKFELIKIKLDWLKNIVDNGLTSFEKIHFIEDLINSEELKKSMQSVWIPNRNAVFINIAASFCESKNIRKIIIGANKEEAKTFKDNTKEFISRINKTLKYSTNCDVQVIAPLINMSKSEIINEGLLLGVPLEYIYSCYKGTKKHCGLCESCIHLKNALIKNNREDLIKKLF